MESHILSLLVVIKLACRFGPVEQLASENENIPRRKTCDHFMMLERRRTTKLTDRRSLTLGKAKTPRQQAQAQTAVRCSALVLRHNRHLNPLPPRPCRWTPEGGRHVNRVQQID